MPPFVHWHHVDVAAHVAPDDASVDRCPADAGLLQVNTRNVESPVSGTGALGLNRVLRQSIFCCRSLWLRGGSPPCSLSGSTACRHSIRSSHTVQEMCGAGEHRPVPTVDSVLPAFGKGRAAQPWSRM